MKKERQLSFLHWSAMPMTVNLKGLLGADFDKRLDNMHLVLTGETKEEFFVGELARRESRNVSYAFDEDKINHPNTAALLAASCLLLFPEKAYLCI